MALMLAGCTDGLRVLYHLLWGQAVWAQRSLAHALVLAGLWLADTLPPFMHGGTCNAHMQGKLLTPRQWSTVTTTSRLVAMLPFCWSVLGAAWPTRLAHLATLPTLCLPLWLLDVERAAAYGMPKRLGATWSVTLAKENAKNTSSGIGVFLVFVPRQPLKMAGDGGGRGQ